MSGSGMMSRHYGGPDNIDNPDVARIRSQIGTFNYGPETAGLKKQRTTKDRIKLDNGAYYEGEW